MLKFANLIRKKMAYNNSMNVLGFIEKNPGITAYDLSKRLNWSTGKVDYYAKQLVKEGIVENSNTIVNGRVLKKYTAKNFKDLINWDEMTHVKRPNDI